MSPVVLVLSIVLLVSCIALIAIILFQSGRTANMSEAVTGSMGGPSGRNKSAARDLFLKRATIICSVVYIVVIIVVGFLSAQA